MNLVDIFVVAVIILCLAGVVWYQVRKKKKGESGCGCGCSGCASSSHCQTADKK